jgi:hypothetical protein
VVASTISSVPDLGNPSAAYGLHQSCFAIPYGKIDGFEIRHSYLAPARSRYQPIQPVLVTQHCIRYTVSIHFPSNMMKGSYTSCSASPTPTP